MSKEQIKAKVSDESMYTDIAEETVSISEFTSGINYENSLEKYKDNMSTAITFLICSIAGYAILVLNWFDIITLIQGKSASSIVTYVTLFILFTVFMGIAIYSLKRAGKNKANISKEADYFNTLSEWLEDNVKPDEVEASYDASDLAEEMKYFERSAYIKNELISKFPDTPRDIIDTITDEYIEYNFNNK